MASKAEDKKLIIAPASLWKRLDKIGKANGQNRSWLVRKAIEKFLESQPSTATSGS